MLAAGGQAARLLACRSLLPALNQQQQQLLAAAAAQQWRTLAAGGAKAPPLLLAALLARPPPASRSVCSYTQQQQQQQWQSQWWPRHGLQQQQLASFGTGAPPPAGGGAQQQGDGEAVVDRLSGMMEAMMANPTMQQLMLSRMPPHMRKPEVLRAMMANPEVRARIAALAQQTGLDRMLSQLDPSKMEAGLSASTQAGLDPAALFERFSQSPTLSARMNDPRVLAALMDMASNGPEALRKYEGDKDVIDAAMEAGGIIQQMQQERAAGGGGGGAPAAAPGIAEAEQQLGVKPEELMQRLMARPDLLERVQDPKVQAALQEVAASPWKIVKYLFNKEVMAAIKEMKGLLQQPPKH